jgi:hypothetical protein
MPDSLSTEEQVEREAFERAWKAWPESDSFRGEDATFYEAMRYGWNAHRDFFAAAVPLDGEKELAKAEIRVKALETMLEGTEGMCRQMEVRAVNAENALQTSWREQARDALSAASKAEMRYGAPHGEISEAIATLDHRSFEAADRMLGIEREPTDAEVEAKVAEAIKRASRRDTEALFADDYARMARAALSAASKARDSQ